MATTKKMSGSKKTKSESKAKAKTAAVRKKAVTTARTAGASADTKAGDGKKKTKDSKDAGQKKSKAPKGTSAKKPKRVSALDAAAQVLKSAGKPLRAQELIVAMAEQGLWTSPSGKTPHATLYAAMLREARDKGNASRFRKVDRGQFAFHKTGV